MASPPAERKALLFSVGDVRLALRLSQVREILPADPASGEVLVRGTALPALPIAVALGIPAGTPRFAIVTEGTPPSALRVDALHGIVELSRAEVFQLPARTLLPQPAPFQGVIAVEGVIALELAVAALGWAPIEPAVDAFGPPPEVDLPAERELLFTRGGRTFAVPLPLLVQVIEVSRLVPVPLTPPSHLGLAYHGRAIHPVLDPAVLYGEVSGGAPAPASPGTVLLVDAGGAQVGLAADTILQHGAAAAHAVTRPSWDALFAG